MKLFCEREKQGIRGRGKVFGLQYKKGLRKIGGDDQADISNLSQNNQNTGVHLKVDGEQRRIARGSKRQAGGCGPHARNLSGLRHTDAPHVQ